MKYIDLVTVHMIFPDARGIGPEHRLFKDRDPLGTRMADVAEGIATGLDSHFIDHYETPTLQISVNDRTTGRGKDFFVAYNA